MRQGAVSLYVAGRHFLGLQLKGNFCTEHECGMVPLKPRLGMTPHKAVDFTQTPEACFDAAFRVHAALTVFEKDGWLCVGAIQADTAGPQKYEQTQLESSVPGTIRAYMECYLNDVKNASEFATNLNVITPIKASWSDRGFVIVAKMGTDEERWLRDFADACEKGDIYCHGGLTSYGGMCFTRISKMDRKVRALHREAVKKFYHDNTAESSQPS